MKRSFICLTSMISIAWGCGKKDRHDDNKAPTPNAPQTEATEIALEGTSLTFPFAKFSCAGPEQALSATSITVEGGIWRFDSLTAALPNKDRAIISATKLDANGKELCHYRARYNINQSFDDMTLDQNGVSGTQCAGFATQVVAWLGDKVQLSYDKPSIRWVALQMTTPSLSTPFCAEGNQLKAYFAARAP